MSGDARMKDSKTSLSHRAQQKFKCVAAVFGTVVVWIREA